MESKFSRLNALNLNLKFLLSKTKQAPLNIRSNEDRLWVHKYQKTSDVCTNMSRKGSAILFAFSYMNLRSRWKSLMPPTVPHYQRHKTCHPYICNSVIGLLYEPQLTKSNKNVGPAEPRRLYIFFSCFDSSIYFCI